MHGTVHGNFFFFFFVPEFYNATTFLHRLVLGEEGLALNFPDDDAAA